MPNNRHRRVARLRTWTNQITISSYGVSTEDALKQTANFQIAMKKAIEESPELMNIVMDKKPKHTLFKRIVSKFKRGRYGR